MDHYLTRILSASSRGTIAAITGLLLAASAQADDGTWIQISAGNASGTWSDAATGNWASGTVASGSDFTANFNTLDITATSTVSLGEPRTIGNLIFGDTNTSTVSRWILDNGGNASNILTLSGTTPTITVNDMGNGSYTNSTVTISAVIDGTQGLTKDGTGTTSSGGSNWGKGTLVLSGANTYSGGTTISSGALRAQNNSALGSGAVTVASGAQLQVDTNVNIANTVNINGANALLGAGSGSNLSGIVNLQSDSGIRLTSNHGNGTMTLSGTVNLNGNTLSTSTINVTPAVNITGVISGNGGVTNNGNGVLRISNDNSATYTGTTTVSSNGSVLEVGNDGALGSGPIAFNTPNDAAATIRSSNSTARTLPNAMTFGSGNANAQYIFGSSTTGDLTFTNTADIDLSTTQRRFRVVNTTQFDGGFIGSAGITKDTNTGTLILNGAVNSYSGTTNINAGTLIINGAKTGTGAVNINSGATLGGSGSVAGATTLATGGAITPGNSIGTLTLDSMTWNGEDSALAQLLFELGSSNTADLLDISGGALSKGTGSVFEFDFLGTGENSSTYTLITFDSTDFSVGDFSYTGLADGVSGSFFLNAGNLQFVTSAVPEPATFALLSAGAMGMLVIMRRRRKA